jgi:uncharacterized membrane protein
VPRLRQSLDVLRAGVTRLAPPISVPLLTGAVAFAVIAWTLLQRSAGLSVSAYDTAFFEQVVWNLSRGHGFTGGFFGANFLGLHFSPLLALPAAVELAWPDARALALLQAAALGLSAPAAYLLLRALLGDRPGAPVAAAALAAVVPLWLALQQAASAGFHTEALALPLLLTAAWAGLSGRNILCWACALAALCAKEDQAYAVAVIGLLLAFHGPSRWPGVALVVVSVLWGAAVELVLMPALRGPVRSDVASYYSWLPHAGAGRIALAIANRDGWLGFAAVIGGMAGLPLLRPAWLALALPPLVGDLLSAHASQTILHLQYALPLVVPVLVAGGLGARSVLDRVVRPYEGEASLAPTAPGEARLAPRGRAALAALALPAVVLGIVFSPLAGQGPLTTSSMQRLMACATALPGEAPVAADDSVAAALAARPVERPLTWARPGDWVIVDRASYVPAYVNVRARASELASVSSEGRRLHCDDGRFQVWGPVS